MMRQLFTELFLSAIHTSLARTVSVLTRVQPLKRMLPGGDLYALQRGKAKLEAEQAWPGAW